MAFQGAAAGIGLTGTTTGAVVSAGAAGIVGTYVLTGDIDQSLRAGAFAAVSAGVANSVAHGTLKTTLNIQTYPELVAYQVASQGVIGALRQDSTWRWSRFLSGAVGAAVSKGTSQMLQS